MAVDRQRAAKGALRIGVIGMGAASIAALARQGDEVVFYEIDPGVIRVAREIFRYWTGSPAKVEAREGDARIVLERELQQGAAPRFDVLALDAFTGNAIPSHLLTAEAFEAYAASLADNGVIAMHVSNPYLDLARVALGHARELGLAMAHITTPADERTGAEGAIWVLLAREPSFLADEAIARVSAPPPAADRAVRWTDDRNSLLPILRWKQ